MPVRALARGVRRVVLRLTGHPDLVRRLEELRAEAGSRAQDAEARFAAEAEWARQRHQFAVERHDALLGRFDDIVRRLVAMGRDEARLAARNGPLAAIVAEEVDRLDGYLVHHASGLRDSLEALRRDLGAGGGAPSAGRRAGIAYTGPGLDAVLMAGDFDLVVPAAEEGLLIYLLRHGLDAVEPGVRAVLRRRLAPGAVAVDAGANIGLHSLAMAAAVGPEGRVLCFEPLPHLAAALERSLRLNGLGGRVRVERAALADQPGEATFHRAAHGPMSSLYGLPEGMVAEDIRVPVTTLDASLPPGSRVDFVKMDVEGAEPRVWRGMGRVIEENPRLEIVLEWSASHFRRSGGDPQAFMRSIRDAGFQAFAVEDGDVPGRLAPIGDPAALEGANLLLTRDAAPEGARAA